MNRWLDIWIVKKNKIQVPYTAEYNPQEYTTRTPTFDPKILEKMDFVSIDRTPNSAF